MKGLYNCQNSNEVELFEKEKRQDFFLPQFESLMKTREQLAEEIRILYVAMTRAQQKLCLVGSVKDGEEALWMNQTRAARIWKTRSMLDMIMPAVVQRVDLPETDETKADALWRIPRGSWDALCGSTRQALRRRIRQDKRCRA